MVNKQMYILIASVVAIGSMNASAAFAQARALRTAAGVAAASERGIVEAQVKRAAFEQTALRNYTANLERSRAASLMRQQVARAEAQAKQATLKSLSPARQFANVNNPGVVYLHYNPVTRQHYIGRSKDTIGYLHRQYRHDLKFRQSPQGQSIDNFKSQSTVIGTASSPTSLKVAEETAIRYYKSQPSISLSNGRYEMSASNYSSAVGGQVAIARDASSLSSSFAKAQSY